MDKRPILNKQISIKDFQEFYWLKQELVKFCRSEGLKTTGGKIEISERIKSYLETGEKYTEVRSNKSKPQSKFDWKNEKLTLKTLITDNYKNTESVRKFFQKEIGKQFKFNIKFMNWMSLNVGKTMYDAINEWGRINSELKNTEEIAPQFEYNRYLKDFTADNPNSKRSIGIKLWNIKKSLRGDNKYRKEDLKLIEKTRSVF